MSFHDHKDTVEENDTVVLYMTPKNVHSIDVKEKIQNKKGEWIEYVFQTSFGSLKVKDLIGQKYGSKVQLSKGWVLVLQPTPEMWTQTLPHRTQIIYTPDISMILFELEVAPGSVVVESGTGSGSLSHAFLRAVKPSGHLHTFDFHEQRVQQAREEFERHGLGDFVSVYHRDVCALGFTEELNGKADAVFLDLPAPHLVVPHAMRTLKDSGGRFCSFSPCIEQTQRVCEQLEVNGFVEVQTLEVLQQEDTIRVKNVPIMDLEFVKHKKTEENSKDNQVTPKETKRFIISTPPQTTPGHTGFLTFATLPPLFAR